MIAQNPVSILILAVILSALTVDVAVAQGSVFSNVDVTKVAGPGAAVKAAAEGFCGANLSTEELLRRQRLGIAAELNFFNPRLIQNFSNLELTQALTCQKERNKILKDVCERAAAVKTNNQCEIADNDKQIAASIASVEKTCPTANAALFVTVTGINDPAPISTVPEVCGAVEKEGPFTTVFSAVDITKTPGNGDQARLAAQKVCGQNLSVGELNHRSNLAKTADTTNYGPKLTAAVGNAPLVKALTCQKARNQIVRTECAIVSARKRQRDFNIQIELLKQRVSMETINTECAGADVKLFV